MKPSAIRLTLTGSILLLSVLACALPGQSSQPEAVPSTIETAIVGTMQAASQQTAVAQLPTATPAGPTGSLIEQLADGNTRYTDYDAGFELTFPAGWLAVRPNSEEFNAALVGEGAVNSMLHDQMAADLNDSADARLLAYILHPEIKPHVIFGFSATRWTPNDSKMLDNASMGELVRGLETQNELPGFRVDVAQIHDDGSTRVIEVGGRWTLNDGTSDPVPFFSVFYFFKPSQDSLVRLAITFHQDYRDEFAADLKIIRESIRVAAE